MGLESFEEVLIFRVAHVASMTAAPGAGASAKRASYDSARLVD
jgi:hypothetical protein